MSRSYFTWQSVSFFPLLSQKCVCINRPYCIQFCNKQELFFLSVTDPATFKMSLVDLRFVLGKFFYKWYKKTRHINCMRGFLMPLVRRESTRFLCLRWGLCGSCWLLNMCHFYTEFSNLFGSLESPGMLRWEEQKLDWYILKKNNYSKLSVHLEMSKAWHYSSETFSVCFGTIKYLKVYPHLPASYFAFVILASPSPPSFFQLLSQALIMLPQSCQILGLCDTVSQSSRVATSH